MRARRRGGGAHSRAMSGGAAGEEGRGRAAEDKEKREPMKVHPGATHGWR